MKKLVSLLLAALLLAGACASALAASEMDVISGNISAGGFIAQAEDGSFFYSLNGLWHFDPETGTSEKVNDDDASCLQVVDATLYYVASTQTGTDENENAAYEDVIKAMPVIGGEALALTQPAPRYYEDTYDANYSQLTESTQYIGYQDMTIYNGYIYYLANDGTSGAYDTQCIGWGGNDGQTSYTTKYSSGSGLFRMNFDGSGAVELISDLGNAGPAMAICNERIAVASRWKNSVFAYDFTDYMLYDLDGKQLSKLANKSTARHSGLFREDVEFTAIARYLLTDGEKVYVSLGDSEGDFASASLTEAGADAVLAYEAFYNNSILLPNGRLVYLASAVQDTFYDEMMNDTLSLCVRDLATGTDVRLAYLPASLTGENNPSRFDLCVLGDVAYLRTAGQVLRVPLAGGQVERLTDAGFETAADCDPALYAAAVEQAQADKVKRDAEQAAAQAAYQAEAAANADATAADVTGDDNAVSEYLLPDSDCYAYSRPELAVYDADTLALMRNEILARHGYPFKKEVYREYFEAKSWYTRDENFAYSSLNATEQANIELIKQMESEQK